MMLLEEGFEVVSVDASDKMLKQAYKTRWELRKEEIYDKWGEKISEVISLVILKSNFKSSSQELTQRFSELYLNS